MNAIHQDHFSHRCLYPITRAPQIRIINIHYPSSFGPTQQLSSTKTPLKPEQTVKVEGKRISGLIAEEEREDASEERQRMRDLVHLLRSAPPGNVYIRERVASCLCLCHLSCPSLFLSDAYFYLPLFIRVRPHIRLPQPSRFGQARFLFRRMLAMARNRQMHHKDQHALPCASLGRSRTLRTTTAGGLWSTFSIL